MTFQKKKGNFQDWLTTVQDTAGNDNDNRDPVPPHAHMSRDIQTAQKVDASVRVLGRCRLGSGSTARFRLNHRSG